MAARRFGARVLTPGVFEEVMVGGPNMDSTVNISFVNQGGVAARVSLVYINGDELSDFTPADFLVCDEALEANSRKEIKGIAVQQGCMLAARIEPQSATVSVLSYGFEEEIG